jgi:hypothetical protein
VTADAVDLPSSETLPPLGVSEFQKTPLDVDSDLPPLWVDLGPILAGGPPQRVRPRLLHRADGHALLYANRVNVLIGDPESGKTWCALAAASEALADRRRVCFIDLDHNGASSLASRLVALGVSEEVLADPQTFRLADPEDRVHLEEIVRALVDWRPALVVVDSLGELLPMLGLNSNSGDEYTDAHRRILRPLARAGAAVVVVDHLAKNPDSRRFGATGTLAKLRAVDGTALRVTARLPFAPGRGGSAVLAVVKDREGSVREHAQGRDGQQSAGMFRLHQVGQALAWSVSAPDPADLDEQDTNRGGRPSAVAEDDVALLAALRPPPTSIIDAQRRMSWGHPRAKAAYALFRNLSGNTFEETS